jgi:DNA-binding transcriptional MerR regulator
MKRYTVHQVATMAGISVRALHHYDQIGLLAPAGRSEAGYRLYSEDDLLRLQQILFYRELDVPLREIGRILDDDDFDPLATLVAHGERLRRERERLGRLLETIERTMARIKGDDMTLTDEELYEGFTREEAERYRREARQQYGEEVVQASEERARRMSKAQWAALKQEGEDVARGLAALVGRDPADAAVQALIARHYATIEPFYHPTAEIYRGLGQLYVEHPEFRAHYERYAEGLAEFMQAAMVYYADHGLAD